MLRRARGFFYVLGFTVTVVFLGAGVARGVEIGVAGPLGGSIYGEQLRRGVEAAVAEINAGGGLLGEDVGVIYRDDGCDPEEAVKVAREFVEIGVVMVVGHFCSGSSIPASEIYWEGGVLQLSPGSPHSRLTSNGYDNVFRVGGGDDLQARFAGEGLARWFGGYRVGLVHDGSEYGRSLALGVREAFELGGGRVAHFSGLDIRGGSYGDLVDRLRGSGIEVVYFGGYGVVLGELARRFVEVGYWPYMVSGDSLFGDGLGSLDMDWGGVILFSGLLDARGLVGSSGIVEGFRGIGYEPEGYTLYAYGAVELWSEAVVDAGSFGVGEVGDILRSGVFETVLGSISYAGNGDRRGLVYSWYLWSGGGYEDVGEGYEPY
ncbi:MAG: branched-chain amino acid ABC transporter substrate-binding protein [Alphaproteobacteria bacterium]